MTKELNENDAPEGCIAIAKPVPARMCEGCVFSAEDTCGPERKCYAKERADGRRVIFVKRPSAPTADADGWIPWEGGECPVSEDSRIDVLFRDGDSIRDAGSNWNWRHGGSHGDIVAYRIIRPADQPAEPVAATVSAPPAPAASHEVRPVAWVHVPAGEPIFARTMTRIEIDDEAAGEFVVLSQPASEHEGAGSIRFDTSEWPTLRAAIDAAVSQCRDAE